MINILWFNRRIDTTEEKITKLKDTALGIYQDESTKAKKLKKKKELQWLIEQY